MSFSTAAGILRNEYRVYWVETNGGDGKERLSEESKSVNQSASLSRLEESSRFHLVMALKEVRV
jgi:hypothetical protein